MAQNLASSEAPTTSNATAIKSDLLSAARAITGIRAKIAELREEENEIKQTKVKANGIKLADFNTVLRWWNLEDDDRNETLDNIRICAEALNVGAQASLFPTGDDIATARADDAADLVAIRAAGKKAGKDGEFGDASHSPYEPDSEEGKAWYEGWCEAQEARAKKLGKKGNGAAAEAGTTAH